METLTIAVLSVVAFIILIIVILIRISAFPKIRDSDKERAGRYGEVTATNAIKSVLRDEDQLFTNVNISFEGKSAELDIVIVNNRGVFVVEVKNYRGTLVGSEDSFEWTKYKTTVAGNTYEKSVRNPIKQVKRQVYILSRYLDYYGSRVWVEGYALLIQGNSPVISRYILSDVKDIDRAIHKSGRNRLSKQQVDAIVSLIR